MLTRSHGLGNDYLVADPAELPFEVTPDRVRQLCDRHVGVGSDGLLLLDGECGLRILNPDGSEAEKSGNGLRIFARWLVTTGRVRDTRFVIHTRGGDAAVDVDDNEVTVDMGRPVFRDDLSSLEIEGEAVPVVALSIGNPHCVIPRPLLDVTELRRLGPLVEHHAEFPRRTNMQLGRAVASNVVELLIWERGTGETQASGSSACAVVAAFHHLGQVEANTHVVARMPGGNLGVRIDAEGRIWQRGPVEEIARITLSNEMVARLRALP